MKQNELQKQIRIGNHLLGKCIDDLDDRKEWWEIYKIQDAEHLMGIKDGWDKPIELTEEILLKCGFEKTYNSEFTKRYECINDMRFEYKMNKNIDHFYLYFNGMFMNGVKHLHQLQNLYFALTGEELDINI